jgi:hypothetical protein
MERNILLVMQGKSLGAFEISLRILSSERSVSTVLSRLSKQLVVVPVSEVGLFAIAQKGLVAEINKLAPEPLEKEEILGYIENLAYETFCPIFESLEHQGYISGNGHHMAQNLMNYVKEDIAKRLTDKGI